MAGDKAGALEKLKADQSPAEHPGGGIRYGSIHQYLRMVTCAIYFGGGLIWYVLSCTSAITVALILTTIGSF